MAADLSWLPDAGWGITRGCGRLVWNYL